MDWFPLEFGLLHLITPSPPPLPPAVCWPPVHPGASGGGRGGPVVLPGLRGGPHGGAAQGGGAAEAGRVGQRVHSGPHHLDLQAGGRTRLCDPDAELGVWGVVASG